MIPTPNNPLSHLPLKPYPKTTTSTVKMATTTPAKIGTRGTIGSLVAKELEHFSSGEFGRHERSQKPRPRPQIVELGCVNGQSRPSLWFLVVSWKRKKPRSGGFLPSMCSVVEVADSQGVHASSRFSYRVLKK